MRSTHTDDADPTSLPLGEGEGPLGDPTGGPTGGPTGTSGGPAGGPAVAPGTTPSGWGAAVLAPPGSLGAAGRVTAVGKPIGCELWWVGADGSVTGAWSQPGDAWAAYSLAGPGSAAPSGGIAAVAKGADLMEVWWIAPDGSVQAAYHDGSWGLYTLAGPGSASTTGGIAAVAKGGDLMEVWWVAPDGSVQASYHDGGWNRYALAGPGEAAPTTGLTAVSEGGDLMEVWWAGPDGSLQGAFHDPTWTRYSLTGAGMVSLTGRLSSWFGQTRHGAIVRVWWIDPRGVAWQATNDGAWTNLAIGAVPADPAGSIAGFAFNPETVGVVWPGADGSLVDAIPDEVTHLARVAGGRALRGVVGLTLRADGSSQWWGDVTNDTFYGYSYAVSTFVRGSGLHVELAGAHHGHVAGYAEPGSSDDLWTEDHPAHPALAGALPTFRHGSLGLRLEHSVDLVDYLKVVLDGIFEIAVGTALTEFGAAIVLGAELVTLAYTGSLVPGAILAGGMVWLTGPGGMFVRVLVDVAGDGGRYLTDAEYAWANEMVFAGSLPPIETLRITSYLGKDGAPFTFPTFGGPTLLNVGPGMYANALSNTATFVHELVHACQIAHTTDVLFTANALATKIADPSGTDSYDYGPAGFEYTTAGLEAQAQIVEDWYLGDPAIPKTPENRNHTHHPRDPESPYYRYITDNLRLGLF